MKRKFPYQRGSRKSEVGTAFIPLRDNILMVSKEHILIKLLEADTYLMEIASNEKEALRIAELLVAKHKYEGTAEEIKELLPTIVSSQELTTINVESVIKEIEKTNLQRLPGSVQ